MTRATGETTSTDATDKDVIPTIATLTVPTMELTTARAIRHNRSAIRTVSMTAAPIAEQGTVLGQRSSRRISMPITTTVPLTAIGSSTRTCTAWRTSRAISRDTTKELPTVVKNYARDRPCLALASAVPIPCKFISGPGFPSGTPWVVLSLENLRIVPGDHAATDLESPILPAASLLPHDHPAYIFVHTIRKHESQ
jgi:hypothetical protein